MWDILEAKRFEGLKKSAINLQGDLIYNKRCPKCTLVPPCKHYKSLNQIMNDANRMVGSKPFKNYISPRKLQSLMNTIRDQSWQHRLNNSLDQEEIMLQNMLHDNSTVNFENHESVRQMAQGNSSTNFGNRNQSLPGIPNNTQRFQMAGVDIISGGSNLRNMQMRKTFLKKGEGRGGSPTEFDLKIDEDMMNKTVTSASKMNTGMAGPIIMPVKRSNNVTTVRFRNKNNSVVFG